MLEPTGNPALDTILTDFQFSPLKTTRLTSTLALLSGPSGNMAVLAGPASALPPWTIMEKDTMQAWQLHRFGLDGLKPGSVPIPVPGPKEVLIRSTTSKLQRGRTPSWN